MIISKKYFIFAFLFITHIAMMNSQVLQQSSAIKFQTMRMPLPFKKNPILTQSYIKNIPNFLEADASGRYLRGKALEPIAREIYKDNFGASFNYVDASYNKGINGIDGLLVKRDIRGNIRKVHIIEIKSGKAYLHANSKIPQLSKEWILNSIDKSLKEKTEALKKLHRLIKKERFFPSMISKNKKEFSRLNAERRLLKKVRLMVENDLFRRFQVSIRYNNGKITVEQWEILKETFKDVPISKRNSDNIFKYSEKKVLEKFSYLDKDNSKLSMFQRYIKIKMFNAFERVLYSKGYSKQEIQSFMYRLRTEASFNPSKEIGDNYVKSDMNESIDKTIENAVKNYKMQMKIMKVGFAILPIIFEGKAVYDFLNGNIGKADFVFNSLSNVVSFSSVFIKQLNPALAVIFIGIDVIKNIYNVKTGKISTTDAVINSVSNLSAVLIGSAAAKATFTALTAAKFTGTIGSFVSSPIGAVIVSGVTLAVTYGVTYFIVNWTGHKLVDKYEAFKSPQRFNLIYKDIKVKYGL